MPPTLIVLAAGLGSRYGSAKQIEPFGPGGETLLELNAFDAISVGVRRIVVVTRAPLAGHLEQLLRRLPASVERHIVIQEHEARAATLPPRLRPWGTAHAVLAAGAPDGDAIAVNADDLYGRDAFATVADSLQSSGGSSAVLAAYPLDHTLSPHGGVSRGVCRVTVDGTLAGIDEVGDLRTEGGAIIGKDRFGRESTFAGATPVSLNLWGLRTSFWPRLEGGFKRFLETESERPDAEFRLPDVIAAEIGNGMRVQVAATKARWVGVTHLADRDPVRDTIMRLFSEGHFPSPLFSEVGP